MNKDLICGYCWATTICDYDEIEDDYYPHACDWCGTVFDETARFANDYEGEE